MRSNPEKRDKKQGVRRRKREIFKKGKKKAGEFKPFGEGGVSNGGYRKRPPKSK